MIARIKQSTGIAFDDFEIRQMMMRDKWRSTRVIEKADNIGWIKGYVVYVKEHWSSYINGAGNRDSSIYAYKADNNMELTKTDEHSGWMPANFMPEWASRISLHVSDVFVQRLQEITQNKLILEGFKPFYNDFEDNLYPFIEYWDKSVKLKRHKWKANPVVFIFEWNKMTIDGKAYEKTI